MWQPWTWNISGISCRRLSLQERKRRVVLDLFTYFAKTPHSGGRTWRNPFLQEINGSKFHMICIRGLDRDWRNRDDTYGRLSLLSAILGDRWSSSISYKCGTRHEVPLNHTSKGCLHRKYGQWHSSWSTVHWSSQFFSIGKSRVCQQHRNRSLLLILTKAFAILPDEVCKLLLVFHNTVENGSNFIGVIHIDKFFI